MKSSSLKLYLLSILVGIVTGLFTVPFRYLLTKSDIVRNYLFTKDSTILFHLLVIACMWCVGLFIYQLVKRFPMISGSGIPQVEGAVSGRFNFPNSFKNLIAKFTGGVLGIGMGLSLGREGPSVQMGAFIAKLIGKWAKASTAQQKYLMTSGASAGLSSAFTAPLASAIFVIEEVEKFDSPKIAISSLLGAIASGWIAKMVFIGNEYALINTATPESLSIPGFFVVFILFSLLLAVIGKIFNTLLLSFQSGYNAFKIPVALKILAVIIVTYILGYYFSDLVAGGESFLLKQAATPQTGILFLGIIIAIKLVFTPLCYSTGFPGGIFLPLLVIGGLTGKWFALILSHLGFISPSDFGFFMVIGMSALFAAVVRSPITGLILILEMTGKFSIFFPMIVVVGITFFISEMIGVKPIYDSLYARLLPSNNKTSEKKFILPFEVGPDSYMENKRIDSIILPEHCQIIQVMRGDKILPSHDETLLIGDRIEIEVYSRDLEKLNKAFRNMANE